MEILLSPPVAFLIYIPLVLILFAIGHMLAGSGNSSEMKSSLYGSGEEAPSYLAAPGYRPFFMIAFFFAILHLGILVLGDSTLNPVTIVYVVGFILALIALILG
jgi:NADH:ubiquinone oxidoreductase subunit 3 (subunit A)